jgi:chromosome segregation ATPase
MESEQVLEQQIRSQIDALREQYPQTKDLYREVCVLMFFRYGITPTTNKLYQLVRKGSMSAPAEALVQFWRDLREKSRVRIAHPDLPEDLKDSAGELIASLWGKAQLEAQQSLSALREQAKSSVLEAQSRQTEAETRQMELGKELLTSRQEHAAAKELSRSLDHQLATALARQAVLETELQQEQKASEELQHEVTRAGAALEGTRHALESASQELKSTKQELEATRAGMTATIEDLNRRMATAETRRQHEALELSAKLDQARTKSDQLQKNIESLREAAAFAAEQKRIEEIKMQGENGDLRQEIGMLEGKLQGAFARCEELSGEVKELSGRHNALNVEVGMARAEAKVWKETVQTLERTLAELSKPTGAASEENSQGAA